MNLEHLFQPIIQYLRTHPNMGALIAFVIAMSESLPLIGTIVPGSVTMTAMGALIGANILPGFSTLVFASLGALTGDTIGFWVGRYFDGRIRNIWPFTRYPQWLNKGEAFFHKHGGKSILLGRFVGPARSTVPLVAGLLNFSWPRFFAAAIPSAIAWAVLYMAPGILLGALALELPAGKATEFIIIGLLFIVGLWLIFWLIQYFFTRMALWVSRRVDRLWSELNQHHSTHFLISFITNRHKPNDHHQLTLGLVSLLCALLFLIIFTLVVVFHSTVMTVNLPLFHFFQSLRLKHIDGFFISMTLFGTPKLLTIMGLLISLALALTRQWRASAHMLAIVVLSVVGIGFFKLISHSPRPTGFYYVAKNSSFPSGHTTLSLTVLGFIAFLTARIMPYKRHWIPYLTAGILITLIGISRLYLGAHWFTDILGSTCLGFAILLAVILSFRRYPKERSLFKLSPIIWSALLFLILLLPWYGYTHVKFTIAKHDYTPTWPTYELSIQNWWQAPLKHLPIYRRNRFGHSIAPFNIQWADDLTNIKSLLTKHGWKSLPVSPTIKGTLSRLAKQNPEYHMPLLPWLYRHKPPKLLMYRYLPNSKKIVELRLWTSSVRFTDSNLPLWVGSLNYHAPSKKIISLKKRYLISFKSNKDLTHLLADLHRYQTKIVVIPSALQPKRIKPLNWYGHVLIIKKINNHAS